VGFEPTTSAMQAFDIKNHFSNDYYGKMVD
jgi:hypothetical protein